MTRSDAHPGSGWLIFLHRPRSRPRRLRGCLRLSIASDLITTGHKSHPPSVTFPVASCAVFDEATRQWVWVVRLDIAVEGRFPS